MLKFKIEKITYIIILLYADTIHKTQAYVKNNTVQELLGLNNR